jgi:FAD/FMN-containing dehydrogenase
VNTAEQSRLSIPKLRADIAGAVVGPGDPGYDAARRVFLPAVDRRPAVIVQPVDAGEVAHVVSLARETGIELAVRGGGHSYAGLDTTEEGIMLDLARLAALEIDAGSRVVRAAGGLTSGEVTRAAAPHGLAVGFGDTGSVGIGGLTLGGGVGSPEEDPVHRAWADSAAAALRQGEDAAYVNFLGDEDSERVRAAYPGSTWDRLAQVKRRYDPENVFRLTPNIPPAAR